MYSRAWGESHDVRPLGHGPSDPRSVGRGPHGGHLDIRAIHIDTSHFPPKALHNDSLWILPLRCYHHRLPRRQQQRRRCLLLQVVPQPPLVRVAQPQDRGRQGQGHQGHAQGVQGQQDRLWQGHQPQLLRRLRLGPLLRPGRHARRALPQGRSS